jgi:putative transposase
VRFYGLKQEFITPYTPEQNGVIERFIGSLKDECVWLHRFESIEHAREVIGNWINEYNSERPHQELGYLSPVAWKAQQDMS